MNVYSIKLYCKDGRNACAVVAHDGGTVETMIFLVEHAGARKIWKDWQRRVKEDDHFSIHIVLLPVSYDGWNQVLVQHDSDPV
jgi:hypothetical protein